jgi:type I restriction enzyme S subunit
MGPLVLQQATKVGTTVESVDTDSFKSLKVGLPDLPEQRRIADVLDTVDAAIQETDAVVEKQEQVKTGLLQDLLTRGLDADGRLRDPEREPEAFRETSIGKLPKDWKVEPLRDLVEPGAPIVYGILKPGKGHPGGIPVIKVKDIKKGHVQDDDLLLTAPEIHDQYRRAELREGDLLFTIRGTVGRMAFVPAHLDGANITQDTARIRIGDANPRFVRYYLGTSTPQAYFDMHTIGQAVTGINLGQLRQTPIVVPPREEQDRIVEVLDQQFGRIDNERAYRSKLQSLKTGLMQDLLTGRVRVPEAEDRVDEVIA